MLGCFFAFFVAPMMIGWREVWRNTVTFLRVCNVVGLHRVFASILFKVLTRERRESGNSKNSETL